VEWARAIFCAPKGYLFADIDMNQAEVRVWAALSGDEVLRKRILDIDAAMVKYQSDLDSYTKGTSTIKPTKPADIHTVNAAIQYGCAIEDVDPPMRKLAKSTTFGLMYGMSRATFSKRYGEHATEVAWDKFLGQFPVAVEWSRRQVETARMEGYLETPFGRIRHLPFTYMADSRGPMGRVANESLRQASNFPTQSCASDINLDRALYAYERLTVSGADVHVVGTVHDQTLWEIREDEFDQVLPVLIGYLETPLEIQGLDIPFKFEAKTGRSWGGEYSDKAVDEFLYRGIEDILLAQEEEEELAG